MTTLPGILVRGDLTDPARLRDALARAAALGFRTVLIEHELPPTHPASADGPALRSLADRAVDLRSAPSDGRQLVHAFARAAHDAAARPGEVVWDHLDTIAPSLRAVLERGTLARAAFAPTPPLADPYALVTGGAGFIGANLADRLLERGERVLLFDNLRRPGVERNLAWLRARHGGDRLGVTVADLRDDAALAGAINGAASVFHLAAQVAVTTSLADPRDDFETNLAGTVALLDNVRRLRPAIPVVFASTNKVYGDLADVELAVDNRGAWQPTDPALRARGIDEDRPLDFHTPYGCSKGAADQYVLDYARSFGLRTAVLRMSCIYGRLQLGNEDQGWVAHFLRTARAGEPVTLFGDGRQVRDILDVDDAGAAYLAARERIDVVRGRAFNLGGGPANAVSLLAVLDEIGTLLGRRVERRFGGWRTGDQRYFVADAGEARRMLGLAEPRPWREGLRRLAEWMDGEAPGRVTLPERAEAAA